MSVTSEYFASPGGKRQHSSTSEDSDTSPTGMRPEVKHVNTASLIEEDPAPDMAVQMALDTINKRLDSLATRVDMSEMRAEVKQLTNTFMEQIEKLEGTVLDTEARLDKMETELKTKRKKSEGLANSLVQQERRIQQIEWEQNDLQQYSRQWNLRV